jgi:L-asparagine oxygenase
LGTALSVARSIGEFFFPIQANIQLIQSIRSSKMHREDNHGRRDDKALTERWLMKTVNVRSLRDHHGHFIEGRPRIVHG